jgi:6-phospho-3-hexuloisomerase
LIRQADGLMIVSASGETPVTLHLARLAHGFGAQIIVFTTRPGSTLAGLAEAVVDVPAAGSRQFGGSLFEQGTLLLFDALILDLTAGDPEAYTVMQARHANLE